MPTTPILIGAVLIEATPELDPTGEKATILRYNVLEGVGAAGAETPSPTAPSVFSDAQRPLQHFDLLHVFVL